MPQSHILSDYLLFDHICRYHRRDDEQSIRASISAQARGQSVGARSCGGQDAASQEETAEGRRSQTSTKQFHRTLRSRLR